MHKILDVRETISKILEEEDLEVVEASDGRGALKVLDGDETIKIAIADILMPGMNGLDFIKESLRKKPNLKIIACSGGGETGGIVKGILLGEAIDLGAVEILNKPFTPDELTRVVFKLLQVIRRNNIVD